ncbi:MAG: alpha/beta hydrolase family esterase [Paracoccaceae bacterium]
MVIEGLRTVAAVLGLALLDRLARPSRLAGPRPVPPLAPSFEAASFEGATGGRDYRLYLPTRPQGRRLPLVVMLHGCGQTAEDFAAATAMNARAEAGGWIVAYPEQTRRANAQGCWNWFRPEHQRRGAGEAAILAELTRSLAETHPVDSARVFVAGFSAGGAAAATLATLYPEVFAAAFVHSGLPVGAAGDLGSALALMRRGPRVALGQGCRCPVLALTGARDDVVHPVNAEALVRQALAGQEDTVAVERPGERAERTVHRDAAGRTLAEHWRVAELGHDWSDGADGRPDASAVALDFFERVAAEAGSVSRAPPARRAAG